MSEQKYKQSTFMAWQTRMPLIQRWALMFCVRNENISEHSHQVAIIAHLLAVIKNKKFNGDLLPDRAAVIGLYHEYSETRVQDINSRFKYSNPELTKQIKMIEENAERECLNTLPEELQYVFEELIVQKEVDERYKVIVKAADILSAYIKANDELRFNNQEFAHVKEGLEPKIKEMIDSMPEVAYFVNHFIERCSATFDQLAGVD